MDVFKRRTKIRRILYSPLTASALLILIFFSAHATIKMAYKYVEARRDYMVTFNEFEQVKVRENSIRTRIEKLRTERGVEDEIRNKFGFIKEGEEVIVIVEPPASLRSEEKEKEGIQAGNVFESILNIFR